MLILKFVEVYYSQWCKK